MRRDVGDSTIGQNVLNSMGATMKQRTAAITIGILFWASGATADTVVVTAERMVDSLPYPDERPGVGAVYSVSRGAGPSFASSWLSSGTLLRYLLEVIRQQAITRQKLIEIRAVALCEAG
jgi:hypothetical protein